MRRLILSITAVAFLSANTAGAFPQNQVSEVRDFIQKTGWNKRPLKLKDLYENEKENLPLPLRFEIEAMLEKYPQAEIPKVEVRTIKNGKYEDIQLIALQGKQAATLTLKMRNGLAADLSHNYKGKDYKSQFSYADVFDPTRMIAQVYGEHGESYADQVRFSRLLRSKELALLRPEDRQKYSESARELIRVAERAQMALEAKNAAPLQKDNRAPAKTSVKKTSGLSPMILEMLLGQKAVAMGYSPGKQPTGSCLVMGWVGTYKNGQCEPPQESWDAEKKCNRCSTTFYGKNAVCGQKVMQPGASNSTAELCNMRNADNKYDFYAGIKNQADFDKKQNEMSLEMNKLSALCKEPKNKDVQECKDLDKRFADFRGVNCEILHKWKEQFTDLKCNGVASGALAKADSKDQSRLPHTPTADVVSEGLGDGTGVDNEGPKVTENSTPIIAAQPTDTSGDCAGLSLDSTKVNCNGGLMLQKTCNISGSDRIFYYCVCEHVNDEIRNNSVEPTTCKARGPVRDPKRDELIGRVEDRELRREERRERYQRRYGPVREKKSFWQENGGWGGFMGGALTVGLAFLMYRQQQTQIQNMYAPYYKMMTPQPLQIAPILAPVTTTPATTYPVNVLPGTR